MFADHIYAIRSNLGFKVTDVSKYRWKLVTRKRPKVQVKFTLNCTTDCDAIVRRSLDEVLGEAWWEELDDLTINKIHRHDTYQFSCETRTKYPYNFCKALKEVRKIRPKRRNTNTRNRPSRNRWKATLYSVAGWKNLIGFEIYHMVEDWVDDVESDAGVDAITFNRWSTLTPMQTLSETNTLKPDQH